MRSVVLNPGVGSAVLRGARAVIAALSFPASARADDGYTFHWAVRTPGNVVHKLGDLQSQIDLHGTPWQRDTVLLYSSECGIYPHDGPQEAELSPTWMQEHLAKLGKHMDRNVKDKNFSGLIVIDYEEWDLLWDRTPSSYKNDWRAYIHAKKPNLLKGLSEDKQEEVFRDTYEQSGRKFYTATFSRIKELRPKAHVSFFGYPQKLYKSRLETAPRVIGYGDGSHIGSRRNDRLAWLWELEDFLSPNVYCLWASVPNPVDEKFENTADEDAEYIRSNAAEAMRLAGGKPVYSVICYKYQRGDNPMSKRMLNQANMMNALGGAVGTGTNGVVLWGSVESKKDQQELEQYFHDTLAPQAGTILAGGGPDKGGNPDDGSNGDPFPTFDAFDEAFNAGDMRTDLNGDGALTFFDYTEWQNLHSGGGKGDKGGGKKGGGDANKGRGVVVTSNGSGPRAVRSATGQTGKGPSARPLSGLTAAEARAALAKTRGTTGDKGSAGRVADGDKSRD